jgi:hypothetical protein
MQPSSLAAISSTQDRHVFLSYSTQDRELALELKHALEACGVNVWIDVDRIRAGSFFVTELEQAIERAAAFVVLVTAASLASGWVREECGRAISLSIQSMFRLPVIPIAVEGAVVPGFLANRHVLQLPARSHLLSVAARIAAALSAESGSVQEHQRRTSIRWHSRCEGFANGDVSILAILEAVAAVTAVIILSTSSGSLKYVTTLAFIAPLALLQTDQSRSLGIRLLRRLQWWTILKPSSDSRVARTIRIATLVFVLIMFMLIGLSFVVPLRPFLPSLFILYLVLFYLLLLGMMLPLLVRSAAILFTALRHPLTTLSAVPINWKNMLISKDLLEEPEVVPGYLDAVSTGELSNDLRLPNFLGGLARKYTPNAFCDLSIGGLFYTSMITFAVIPAILLYVPYYTARWALKSTAIIWAPLLWIAAASNGSTLPLRLRLQIIVEDATSRTVFAFSWLTLIILIALRLGIFPSATGSDNGFSRIIFPLQQPLAVTFIVGAALITIGLRLIASRILLLNSHRAMPLTIINKAINVAIFVQRLIVLLLLIMILAKLLEH